MVRDVWLMQQYQHHRRLTHGRYLSEMKIKDESELVRGKQRDELGKKLWNEIIDVFTQHGLNAQRGFPGNA